MTSPGTLNKPDQLDFTSLSAEDAAKALYDFCAALSLKIGQDPTKEVFLLDPQQAARLGYGRHWRVLWESGPIEWALSLSLGGSLWQGQEGDYSYTKPAEVKLTGSPRWKAEPYWNFDLGFEEI